MKQRQRQLVVAGAGGLGREIADAIVELSRAGQVTFAGFLDDRASGHIAGLGSVLGPVAGSSLRDDFELVLGVGDPELRKRMAYRLGPMRQYATVVHPTAFVSTLAKLGVGAFVGPFSYVGPGSHIGAHGIVNVYGSVGHDVTMREYGVLSPYACLSGHATLGAGVFLGSKAVVGVGVEVGAWSRVASGAVVAQNCDPGSLVSGNPAKGRVLFRAPVDGETP